MRRFTTTSSQRNYILHLPCLDEDQHQGMFIMRLQKNKKIIRKYILLKKIQMSSCLIVHY